MVEQDYPHVVTIGATTVIGIAGTTKSCLFIDRRVRFEDSVNILFLSLD